MDHESKAGDFCWNELASPNVKKSAEFYERLLGWTSQTVPIGPGETYTLFLNRGEQIGGMRALSGEEQNVPPHWMSYIATDDVDGLCEKASTLGGQVVMGPLDIPGVGRFGFLKDSTGADFAVWKNLKK